MSGIAAKISDLRSDVGLSIFYSEATISHVIQSEWVLAAGFAQWMLFFICGAIWVWWPLSIAGLLMSLQFSRLVGNATWDEFSPPHLGDRHE